MKRLRAYFWKPHIDHDYGIVVIAHNIKEARNIGYAYWGSDVGHDDDFIDQHCKWIRKFNLDGITKPTVLSAADELRRNLYGWFEGEPCDECGQDEMLYHHEGKALCNHCIEGVTERGE